MQFLPLAILSLASLAAAKPAVYLIRHGEKPSDGGVGLSAQGMQRAQCLRNVFGASSDYHIGYILAQAYKSDGSRERPYETVKPLADDLGLTVDTSCDRDDEDCVADAVSNYDGDGAILICWEHKELSSICEALGGSSSECPDYPSDHYNYIWTDDYKHGITNEGNEDCPGLDN